MASSKQTTEYTTTTTATPGGGTHKRWHYAEEEEPPKCVTKNCECFAAKNEYYPNSEGGEFWTLCEKCYKEDQEQDEDESEEFRFHLRQNPCQANKIFELDPRISEKIINLRFPFTFVGEEEDTEEE